MDSDIWDEDWFIELPNDHKLFYLYITAKTDQSGIWRPNRRKFQMVIHGKMIMLDEFLNQVNKPDEFGRPVTRIRVLENGNWLIVSTITRELGKVFYPRQGNHRGAFSRLVNNGVHLREIPDMDWCGLETLDLKALIKIANTSALYRQSIDELLSMYGPPIDDASPTHSPIFQYSNIPSLKEVGGVGEGEKKDPSAPPEMPPSAPDNPPSAPPSSGSGSSGQSAAPEPVESVEVPPPLPHVFQVMYEKDYQEMLSQGLSRTHTLTAEGFNMWKEFIDTLVKGDFNYLFKISTFINPWDFEKLFRQKGFKKDLWEPVARKLCSAGVYKNPNVNLYFKIQDYIKYVQEAEGKDKKRTPKSFTNSSAAGLHVGNITYKDQKWPKTTRKS
jgi:hypothetical protein